MGQACQGTQEWYGRLETGLRVAVASAVTLVAVVTPALAAAEGPLPSVMVQDRSWDGRGRSFDGILVPDSATTVADGDLFAEADTSAAEPPATVTSGWTTASAGTDDLCWPANCDPVGLLQRCHAAHLRSGSRWIGRADGLLLWRDAPPARPIVETGELPSLPVLGANQLQSTATGGVRGSLLRVDGCCGHAWELTYIYAGNFTAQRALPYQDGFPYALSPPGIYGNNESQPFDSGTLTLLGRLQSGEINRHVAWGPNFRWLAGFRWVQWHEQFSLRDTLVNYDPPITDLYRTTCDNNLYGGQIGADARLLSLGWFRLDSVVKAGAYYNNAVQTSLYATDDPGNPGSATVAVGQSPAACSFVGEVGLTGVLPLTSNLDFRFGYFGLWLTGLAQPTQQLSGQQVTPNNPTSGTITANGGTLLQGLSLGLEGRW